MTESPSLLLQRAAQRLLEMSSDPMGPPKSWWADWPEGQWGEHREPQICGRGKPLFVATEHATVSDMEWVETMSPAAATPLVAWLRYAQCQYEVAERRVQRYDYGSVDNHVSESDQAALDFARQVLGLPSRDEEE